MASITASCQCVTRDNGRPSWEEKADDAAAGSVMFLKLEKNTENVSTKGIKVSLILGGNLTIIIFNYEE